MQLQYISISISITQWNYDTTRNKKPTKKQGVCVRRLLVLVLVLYIGNVPVLPLRLRFWGRPRGGQLTLPVMCRAKNYSHITSGHKHVCSNFLQR
jgi:hypothetical protein